jgi:hypothetical protein
MQCLQCNVAFVQTFPRHLLLSLHGLFLQVLDERRANFEIGHVELTGFPDKILQLDRMFIGRRIVYLFLNCARKYFLVQIPGLCRYFGNSGLRLLAQYNKTFLPLNLNANWEDWGL